MQSVLPELRCKPCTTILMASSCADASLQIPHLHSRSDEIDKRDSSMNVGRLEIVMH